MIQVMLRKECPLTKTVNVLLSSSSPKIWLPPLKHTNKFCCSLFLQYHQQTDIECQISGHQHRNIRWTMTLLVLKTASVLSIITKYGGFDNKLRRVTRETPINNKEEIMTICLMAENTWPWWETEKERQVVYDQENWITLCNDWWIRNCVI